MFSRVAASWERQKVADTPSNIKHSINTAGETADRVTAQRSGSFSVREFFQVGAHGDAGAVGCDIDLEVVSIAIVRLNCCDFL